jgi:adhesin transport system outer membrane protein
VVAATHVRESLTLKVRANVQAQWYELLASQSSLRTFTEYVNSAEQVVQAYSEQFKIGRRSLLDVLNAENELFTARSNVVSVEQDVVLASWRLLGLRGLSRQELGL